MRSLALFAFGLTSLVLSNPAAAQEASYKLKLFGVEPDGRAESRASAERLPRGVTGALPTTDGGHFALMVDAELYAASSTEEVQRALDELLPATGFAGSARELWPALEGERRAGPDVEALLEMGRAEAEARVAELERRVGPLTEATAAQLEADLMDAYEAASATVVVWRFDQLIDGARAEGRSVLVETDGKYIRRIVGALYAEGKLSNAVELREEKAIAIAEAHAAEVEGRASSAELVALADGDALVAAWRVEVDTVQGPYVLWVEAQKGEIIQVEAEFSSVSAQGIETVPGLPLGFELGSFEVDSAASCKYTLDFASMLTLSNAGADGVTDDVKGCLVGGAVDYDVSPINDTTELFNANDADYNGLFQQVTVFSQVYGTLDWFDLLGASPLPVWSVTVNHNNPCGFGIDNACGGLGNLTMGIGGMTMGVWNGALWNTSLDESVVVHETGHGLIRVQMKEGGGTLVGSLDEGVADYWAMSRLETDMVGVVTTGTTSDVQTGFIPRQADAVDVFPEHMSNFNEIHANGQIIARALWDARTEMEDRSIAGNLINDMTLMSALVDAGVGQTNNTNFKSVHDAFLALEISMLVDVGAGPAAADLLVGFARAGVTTTDKEAIIDISDDILASSDGPPTFTVWTGRDYAFSGSGLAAGSPYNTRYEVEVASDAAFTQNLISSGTQSNVAINSSVPSATWSLTAKQWDSLNDEDQLYFRVTTWTPDDPDSVRTSTHWYGEFVEIQPSKAIINQTGGTGCSTSGAKVSGLAGLALAGLALLRRRR